MSGPDDLSGRTVEEPAAAANVSSLVPTTPLVPRNSVFVRLRRRPVFWAATTVAALLACISTYPAAFAGWFGHGDPRVCDLANSALGPQPGHPFGFDIQGCDLYANVIYGARNSIQIGLLTTAIGLAVAVVLGSAAGYYGRWFDAMTSRLADVFFGFPFLLGAIVVLSTFRLRGVLTVSATLALFTWPTLMRLMRSTALQTRESDYVTAARSIGASDLRIITRHVVPNAIAPVMVIATITVGSVIAAEATLTFLGVGLQHPAISWGLQLASAQQNFQSHPHILVFPGLFLCITVLTFILFGDELQSAMDPER
jgi:oligopeptide transport system permease protein